ncbi:LamG domain-containing protein [Streptomyces sp. MS2.AVA.5]|uniref:LamG domain-containing protein n=1 Tax=Streptomyces achmelvichensis TaxID=3134111 RepID=A0ACC6Q7S1_9ACTN
MPGHRRRSTPAWAAIAGATLLAGLLTSPAFGATGDAADDPVPRPPRITSQGPYTECTANDCVGRGEPGLPGLFTFRPNEADVDADTGSTDVTGYRVRLIDQMGAVVVNGAEPPPYTAVPSVAGLQVLEVQARDWGERWGPSTSFLFMVKQAPGAVGQWQFADRPSNGTGTTTKDTATEGTERHDAALKGGATWSDRARRGEDDYSLDLNSTGLRKPKAYATTAGPPINTGESFTVSTWAYLADTTSDQVVLSAPGTHDAAFELSYSAQHKKWAFGRGAQDRRHTSDVVSYGDAAQPPARVWTHLAGVFDTKRDTDTTNDTIQLFVNGRPQGQPVTLSTATSAYRPWTSARGLQIGRTKANGHHQRYFHGYVDEAAVWQRALRPRDLRLVSDLENESEPATTLVADWNAGPATTGNTIKDYSRYSRTALNLSPEGAQLLPDSMGQGRLVLDGIRGYADASGPVVDETGSFTVSARVSVNGTEWASKPVGYRGIVAAQNLAGTSSWALVLTKLDTDVSLWSFVRTAVDAAGNVTGRVEAQANDVMTDFDTPIDLTGTYDAAAIADDPSDTSGKLTLYIGTSAQATSPQAGHTSQTQGTGNVTVGRAADGDYLSGTLDRLRIWAGALTANGVGNQVP